MSSIKLFHGSDHIIKKPLLGLGKVFNDYGQGFYCCEDKEIAKEWASKENKDGFVNGYSLNLEGLRILDLTNKKYSVLNWIAILLKYRIFNLQDEIAMDARDYIIDHYSIELSEYDLVKGYRADDSYFSYAQSFVENSLPLATLGEALKLGHLGIQIVLKSNRSFEQLGFEGAEPVNTNFYHLRFLLRDLAARETYQKELKKKRDYQNDVFVMDILRWSKRDGSAPV